MDARMVLTTTQLTVSAALLIGGSFAGATTGAFSSNVTIGGTLGVTGNTTLFSTLTQNGTTADVVQSATSGTLTVGSASATGGNTVVIRGIAGQFRWIQLRTGTSNRFAFGLNNAAESGSNAGSSLFFADYDDSGAFIGNPLIINRGSTGSIIFRSTSPITGGTYNGQTISSAASFTGTVTAGSTIIAPAATTSIPSIRLPHGTAPSSPTNGDVWTTTAGLFARINGATVGPFATSAGSGDVVGPASATDNAIVRYNGTTGKLVQNSGATITDEGVASFSGTSLLSTQYDGFNLNYRHHPGAIAESRAVNIQWGTQAIASTLARLYALEIVAPSIGATSSVENLAALKIGSVTGGTTTSYAIQTGSGAVAFGDVVGVGAATPVTGTALITPASTTSRSSVRVPHGTAPSSPTNGDYWTDTSSAKVRINGVTHYASWARGSAIADPTGGATVDTEARAAIAALLAHSRTVNFIAT